MMIQHYIVGNEWFLVILFSLSLLVDSIQISMIKLFVLSVSYTLAFFKFGGKKLEKNVSFLSDTFECV